MSKLNNNYYQKKCGELEKELKLLKAVIGTLNSNNESQLKELENLREILINFFEDIREAITYKESIERVLLKYQEKTKRLI